jgi:hypothetical protein
MANNSVRAATKDPVQHSKMLLLDSLDATLSATHPQKRSWANASAVPFIESLRDKFSPHKAFLGTAASPREIDARIR